MHLNTTGPGVSPSQGWAPTPSGNSMITLTAVVNGAPAAVHAGPELPLQLVVGQALQQTGNEGRPVDQWTITNAFGRLLDRDRTVGELGLEDHDTVFVQVEVGAGG